MTVLSTPITHKYKWPTVSGGACIDMRVAGRSEPQRATIPRIPRSGIRTAMLRGSVQRAGAAVSFNYLGLKIRTDPRTFHECIG